MDELSPGSWGQDGTRTKEALFVVRLGWESC